jgi:hypothetical protein
MSPGTTKSEAFNRLGEIEIVCSFTFILASIAFPMLYAAGLDSLYLLLLMSPFVAMICAGEVVAWIVFSSGTIS